MPLEARQRRAGFRRDFTTFLDAKRELEADVDAAVATILADVERAATRR